MSDCCEVHTESNTNKKVKRDWLLWGGVVVTITSYAIYLINQMTPIIPDPYIHFPHSVYDLFNKMFLGIFLGVFFVGLLSYIPREVIISSLGRHRGIKGILRATLLGLFLDLCSHGILLVGLKLYERGATIGQTMAFLIASPWNSFSLTLILISLIGLPWTLLFILLSGVIAILSGLVFEKLEEKNYFNVPKRSQQLPENYQLTTEIKGLLKNIQLSPNELFKTLMMGLKESRPILKWLFFGLVLASLIQTFIPTDIFKTYFGPSLLGLFLTLVTTTLIEVCSEGSTPIAADLFTRAAAPGNAFTFLMAGVATDYTEIISIKETTRSWKVALFLPLITVPQVLIISYFMNS